MYKLVDPLNNKIVDIGSLKGNKVLKNYINYYQQGSGDYFKNNSGLSIDKKKYCRCVLHVLPNNTKTCNKKRFPIRKKGCYNPYAVCASKIKTSTGSSSCRYNFLDKEIKIEELIAYTQMNYLRIKEYVKTKKLGNLDQILKEKDEKSIRNILSKWYDSKKLENN